jgi:hypothetical protein
MLGRTPTAAEKQHMQVVGNLPCIACEKDGHHNDYITLHHVDGRVKPDAHFKVLPLCGFHHQHEDTDPMGRIGIHPNKARFEAIYGTSTELLDEIRLKIESNKTITPRNFLSEQAAHQAYVALKKQWDEQNPDATSRQRDAAVNQISKECGV